MEKLVSFFLSCSVHPTFYFETPVSDLKNFAFSDICLIGYDSQSMERTQRVLYVNVTNT